MSGYYSPWYGIEDFLFMLIPILLVIFVYNYINLRKRNQNIAEANFYQSQLKVLENENSTQEQKSAAVYSFRFLKSYRRFFQKNQQQIQAILEKHEGLVEEFKIFLKRSTQIYWVKFAIWSTLGVIIASSIIRHVILWAY